MQWASPTLCQRSRQRLCNPSLRALATATVGAMQGECGSVAAMTLLTIREAAESTGHSTHKIRRLIKSIAEQSNHPDRTEIEPNPTDVERLTAEHVQFTWRISDELVKRVLPASPATTPAKPAAGEGETWGDALGLLQRALTAQERMMNDLQEQLKVKDSQIQSLNERLRESNVLMASLQQQLPAPDGKRSIPPPATPASPAAKGRPPAAAKPGRRRSWLQTMFG